MLHHKEEFQNFMMNDATTPPATSVPQLPSSCYLTELPRSSSLTDSCLCLTSPHIQLSVGGEARWGPHGGVSSLYCRPTLPACLPASGGVLPTATT